MIGLDLLVVWAYLSGYLAQGDIAQPVPVSPSLLEQYGPGGVLALIILGFAWPLFRRYEKAIDLEREEKLAAQAEARELHKITRELTIPAVTKAADALTEVMKALRKDHPS